MGKLRIRNWEKFQQYRDREPKWIKVYRSLLRDYEFSQLSEPAQAQLLKLWLLAAETDNEIPDDEAWIKSQIGTKGKLLIQELVTHRFIEPYNSVQNCTDLYTETETERETETEGEREGRRKQFEPPTLDEVRERIAEMGYRHVDAERFWYFYESKNWMVGKNKMQDWRMALGGWESRDKQDVMSPQQRRLEEMKRERGV